MKASDWRSIQASITVSIMTQELLMQVRENNPSIYDTKKNNKRIFISPTRSAFFMNCIQSVFYSHMYTVYWFWRFLHGSDDARTVQSMDWQSQLNMWAAGDVDTCSQGTNDICVNAHSSCSQNFILLVSALITHSLENIHEFNS